MTTGTALLIAAFFLCAWPLMFAGAGFWIGRRVDQVRSPFVLKQRPSSPQRGERRPQGDEMPYRS